ncbi:MAG: TIGR02281 family clan AA aspartic protease [Nitrospinota bacterium]
MARVTHIRSALAYAVVLSLAGFLSVRDAGAALFYRDPGGFFRLAVPPGWGIETEPLAGVQTAFRDAPGPRARASVEVSSFPLRGLSLSEWVKERLAADFALHKREKYRLVRQGYRRLGEALVFEFVRQYGKGKARQQVWDLLAVHRDRALRVVARTKAAEWARFVGDFRRCLYSLELTPQAEWGALSLRVGPGGGPLYRGTSSESGVVALLSEGTLVRFLHRIRVTAGAWYHVQAEDPRGEGGLLRGFLPAGRVSGGEAFEERLRRLGVGWLPAGAAREARAGRVVVPFQKKGTAILVPVEINRRKRATFILDTGATFTTISPELARAVGLSIPKDAKRVRLTTALGEVVEAPLVRLSSVRVRTAEARDVEAVVHSMGRPGKALAGLLGLSFLRHFDVTIDSAQGQLILVRK